MRLISEHNFSVVPGEPVVIRVMPSTLEAYLLVATLNGQLLQPSGDGFPAEYSFTATHSGGMTDLCVLQASFAPGSTAGAAYQVLVGSYGEGEEFSIPVDEQTKVVELRFHVEASDEVNDRASDVSWNADPPIIVQHNPPEPWD